MRYEQRCPPERTLQDDPAARERLGANDEHQEDRTSGMSSGRPELGNQRCWLRRYAISDCSIPMKSPPSTAGMTYWKRPSTAAADRGHDEERVGDRDERHDGRDEDAGDGGDRRADHPVRRRDSIGRDAADERSLLRFGGGPRVQAEERVKRKS